VSSATNLTPPPTPLVGRTREIDDVRGLLDAGAWLVTLLGPAGIGKTRLALRVAELESAGVWKGGVWACALAELRTIEAVCGTIAHATRTALDGHDPIGGLGARLRQHGRVLVVLDNCEHLTTALGDALARWQILAPESRWVITTRERTRVAGEQVYEVPPLSLPGPCDAADSEAVQLFVERAARVRPAYRPTLGELEAIGALVRRLDGLPLAIELAAARAGVLDTSSLLERMSSRFELLSAGARTLPLRQRTLRAAIDGSWELLTPDERRALTQCAVFRGGFTLRAAEHVLDVATPQVLPLVESLHDKSLLRTHAPSALDQPTRFDLYESIREYALERLEKADESQTSIERHRRHFARWGYATGDAARYDGSAGAATELVRELDNLVYASDRALEGAAMGDVDAADDALRLAVALRRPIVTRESLTSYAARLDATLALPAVSSADPALVAAAYRDRAIVRYLVGHPELAVDDSETALAHAVRSGNTFVEATILIQRATMVSETGRHAEAREGVLRAARLFAERGHAQLTAAARTRLAALEVRLGNLEEAHGHAAAAVATLRTTQDVSTLGLALGYLGLVQHLRGELSEAREGYAAGLRLLESCGERRQSAAYRGFRALLALEQPEQGDSAEARAELEVAVASLHDVGDAVTGGCLLAAYGALLAAEDDVVGATERYDEAERWVSAAGGAPLAAVNLQRGHVELARARRARAAGDFALASTLRAQVEARLRTAQASPQQLEETLLARRLLEVALARDAERASERDVSRRSEALVVHYKGDWFELPSGRRVACRGRRVVRSLIAVLAENRVRAPGEAVETEALIRAGWPDERLNRETAEHRLRSSLYMLRRLGLQRHLVAAGRGYLLDPEMPCRVVGCG
jgi:predicted ATPase